MEQSTNNAGEMQITQQMLDIMKVTKRWTRFLSVLGFVVTGLLCLFSIFSFVPSMSTFKDRDILIALMPFIFFATLLFIYFYPSLLLSRYASSIKKLLKSGNITAMETALDRQKKFWKYIGIMVIILFLVYGIFLAGFSIYLLPKFMASRTNNETLMSTADCESQRDGIVGEVRAGIAFGHANNLTTTSLDKYPSKLDSSLKGPASDSNPLFGEVLSEGVSDTAWSKEGNKYTFKCDGKEYVFEYNSKTGTFSDGIE